MIYEWPVIGAMPGKYNFNCIDILTATQFAFCDEKKEEIY